MTLKKHSPQRHREHGGGTEKTDIRTPPAPASPASPGVIISPVTPETVSRDSARGAWHATASDGAPASSAPANRARASTFASRGVVRLVEGRIQRRLVPARPGPVARRRRRARALRHLARTLRPHRRAPRNRRHARNRAHLPPPPRRG